MAAYAALASLMNDLEFIPIHPRHSFSFENKQIASLSQTARFLMNFMESHDSQGCSREVLESWIASAAHAAHDVVERHVVNQVLAGSTLRAKPWFYFLLDLQKAIDNMDFVKRKAMQYAGKNRVEAEQHTHNYSPTTSSEPQTFRKNMMVGFDAIANRLLEILTRESSSLLVIPIVGMGGIGKTTLAKNTYEHSLVGHHFDVRLWATVSQEYSAETILTQLFFGERKSSTGVNVNELGNELRKKLWGRRYLVILDDMWSMEAWYQIQRFFPDNSKGSRVIVTTRLSNLASNLCSSPFKMEFLDEDESWKLFCGNAFGEKECPLELEGIGKKIVRKCQGLPLSIVVIGGHLRKSSRAVEYWKKVANLMNPILSLEEGDKCMQIINLSYEQLPIGVKPCFLYMMKFREDELIHVTELLRLWVAEGFVRAKEGLSLEEVAEDYLNDLIDRNLVLVRERKWNGKPEYCGIHDIARELCMKVGKKGKFLRVSKKTVQEDASREQRIVILDGTQVIDFVDSVEAAPLLRLLRRDKIMELRMSRVCRAGDGVQFMNIPRRGCPLAGDFEQVNLRYLRHPSYSETSEIRCHPSLISQFWNLQTLIILRFGIVITAPQDIWYMAQLRHVECYRLYLPDPIPSGQQECVVLQNLQTLNGVWNLRLNEEVCKIIPNVKEMHVSYDVEDCSDYYPDNLGRFSKLESLHLFRPGLVQRLTFPRSLHELHLWDSNLRWEDVAVVVESLPHLGALRLCGVKGCEWSLAEEEEFPRLKYLMIKFCFDLVYWNACSSNFPALERLEIVELPELIEIPFEIGEIPTLEHITLVNCNVPAAVSALRILMEQDSFGSHNLQLHVNYFRMEDEELFQKIVEEEDLQSYNLHLFCMESKPQVFEGSQFYVS